MDLIVFMLSGALMLGALRLIARAVDGGKGCERLVLSLIEGSCVVLRFARGAALERWKINVMFY